MHSPNEDITAPLVQLKDNDSWQTLLRAAKKRNHQPLLDIAKQLNGNELPQLTYHAKCRKLFTMKKQLEAIEHKESPIDELHEIATVRRSIREQPSTSRVYEQKCILCQKQSKYISGSKTREVLQKCVTTGADAKLREVAVSKLDDRVVPLLGREAVAAEAHFHRSCYRAYTKEDYVKKCSSTDSPAENEYCKIEDKAFQYVCHYIRCNLFVNPRAIMFNDLRTMLLDHMKELGCTQVSDST